MRSTAALRFLALSVALALVAPAPAQTEQEALQSAQRFGRALVEGDLDALGRLLPAQGKVRLQLERLGPARGYFGAGQVRAVLGEFLDSGVVSSVKVQRHSLDEGICLVHAVVALIDREDRAAEVRVQLSFHGEGRRWVLRTLRELS